MGCCEQIFLLGLPAEPEKVAKQSLTALKSCRRDDREDDAGPVQSTPRHFASFSQKVEKPQQNFKIFFGQIR